jgi:hypothetical protein
VPGGILDTAAPKPAGRRYTITDVELTYLFPDPTSPDTPTQDVTPLEVRDVVLDPIFGKRRDALLRTDLARRA